MQRTLAIVSLVLALAAPALRAQEQHRGEVLRNADGQVFDFTPDGGWRVQARRVAAYRRMLMARGDYTALNAPVAAASVAPTAAAVTGIRRVPAILFRFADSATAATAPHLGSDTANYRELLFDNVAPTGMGYSTPYSIRTFYSQISNGLLDLQGRVLGWYQLPGNESTYTGGENCDGVGQNPQNPHGGSNCNGIFSGPATTAMQNGLREALTLADPDVDFGLYDNDGPDGNPNSGDDNGVVDMMIFIHSEKDGACFNTANPHLWSHRYSIQSGGFTTNDSRTGGGSIRVTDYTLQSGAGGAGGCTASQIMAIGTAAHESGHAFGLPDLYDTQLTTEGIGNWGLMGAGNQTSAASPSRMEAWSLNELGWITVVPLTTNGTYSFGPASASTAPDTAFLIRVQGANPRKEFFFLENRQFGAPDSALIRFACGRSNIPYPTCRGGLAIWHVDSTRIAQAKSFNQMNAGTYHGLSLIQADNRRHLELKTNRGDAGDLFPGFSLSATDSLPNTRYSFDTSPAALTDSTQQFVGFEVSSITQVVPDGAMSFQLTFGGLTIVAATDTTAKIKFDGVAHNRFAGILADGSNHSISMDSAQTTADGKTQFVWQSWSDGQPRTHDITGTFAGASYTATLARKYKIQATTQGSGSVVSAPVVNHTAGVFVDSNSTITLTATGSGGSVFNGWIGDTTSSANPLVLQSMKRGYEVTATFAGALAATPGTPPGAIMGKSYLHNLSASGGTGQYSWTQTGGAFPLGITLANTGAVTGVPEVAGSFTANVRVTSGAQTANGTVDITVTEPTVAQTNALGALLGTPNTLTQDERTYLDLIGNKSNAYDVGDFLAWVEKTNASPAPRQAAPRPEGDPQ